MSEKTLLKRIEELEEQQEILKKDMAELQFLVLRLIHKNRKEKSTIASK